MPPLLRHLAAEGRARLEAIISGFCLDLSIAAPPDAVTANPLALRARFMQREAADEYERALLSALHAANEAVASAPPTPHRPPPATLSAPLRRRAADASAGVSGALRHQLNGWKRLVAKSGAIVRAAEAMRAYAAATASHVEPRTCVVHVMTMAPAPALAPASAGAAGSIQGKTSPVLGGGVGYYLDSAGLRGLNTSLLLENDWLLAQGRNALCALRMRRDLDARLRRRIPDRANAALALAALDETPLEGMIDAFAEEVAVDLAHAAPSYAPPPAASGMPPASAMPPAPSAAPAGTSAAAGTLAPSPSAPSAPSTSSKAPSILAQWRGLGGHDAPPGIPSGGGPSSEALEALLLGCARLAGPPLPPSLGALAERLAALVGAMPAGRRVRSMRLALRGRDGASVHLIPPRPPTMPSAPAALPTGESVCRPVALPDGAVRGTGILPQTVTDGAMQLFEAAAEAPGFAACENNLRLAEWIGVDMQREGLLLLPIASQGGGEQPPIGALLVALTSAHARSLHDNDILALAAVAQHTSLAMALMGNPPADGDMRPIAIGPSPHSRRPSSTLAPAAPPTDIPFVDTPTALAAQLAELMLELQPAHAAALGAMLTSSPQLVELGDAVVGRLADAGLADMAAAARGDIMQRAARPPPHRPAPTAW